jgi:AcrR family transcriptional regulator
VFPDRPLNFHDGLTDPNKRFKRLFVHDPSPQSDTRRRLLDAGLTQFAAAGFDGANVRAIAAAAGANVAAVNYHFGGKQEFYLAVARHVVDDIRTSVWPGGMPVVDPALAAAMPAGETRAMLHVVVSRAARILVASPEAERWARFIVREQLEPTAAFEILYDGVLRHVYDLVGPLVARLLGIDPASREARLEMFSLVGQALVFRFARAAVQRRLGWNAIGEPEADAIIAQLHRAVDRLGARP